METRAQLAREIVAGFKNNGFQAYWAGGCVRDIVMKEKPKDYDIATDAHPQDVSRIFHRVIAIKPRKGVSLVILKGTPFEVTTFRAAGGKFGTDPNEDMRLRDFTINALFYDPQKHKLLDPLGGKKDITKRIIKTADAPDISFGNDYLRLLRAVRFSANLNFKIEPRTFAAIKAWQEKISLVSKERVRGELVKIMTGPEPYRGIKLMEETGLLKQILPEVERLKGVPQPEQFHPEGDVYVHTLLILKKLKNPSLVLAFSCLLHDVGKPDTLRIAERIRFDRHDKVSGQIAGEVLKRLKFSNRETEQVTACIDNHIRIISAPKMRLAKLKTLMLRPTFNEELELHRLDCLASHRDLRIYRFLKNKYRRLKAHLIIPRPLLNGHELMGMKIPPGPKIGKIQKRLISLQMEGKIKTKPQARRWVKSEMLN